MSKDRAESYADKCYDFRGDEWFDSFVRGLQRRNFGHESVLDNFGHIRDVSLRVEGDEVLRMKILQCALYRFSHEKKFVSQGGEFTSYESNNFLVIKSLFMFLMDKYFFDEKGRFCAENIYFDFKSGFDPFSSVFSVPDSHFFGYANSRKGKRAAELDSWKKVDREPEVKLGPGELREFSKEQKKLIFEEMDSWMSVKGVEKDRVFKKIFSCFDGRGCNALLSAFKKENVVGSEFIIQASKDIDGGKLLKDLLSKCDNGNYNILHSATRAKDGSLFKLFREAVKSVKKRLGDGFNCKDFAIKSITTMNEKHHNVLSNIFKDFDCEKKGGLKKDFCDQMAKFIVDSCGANLESVKDVLNTIFQKSFEDRAAYVGAGKCQRVEALGFLVKRLSKHLKVEESNFEQFVEECESKFSEISKKRSFWSYAGSDAEKYEPDAKRPAFEVRAGVAKKAEEDISEVHLK